jgi:hypothetical protein
MFLDGKQLIDKNEKLPQLKELFYHLLSTKKKAKPPSEGKPAFDLRQSAFSQFSQGWVLFSLVFPE